MVTAKQPARRGPIQRSSRSKGPFLVVGLGASAGGLEAFRELLEALPASTGMAFVFATPGARPREHAVHFAGGLYPKNIWRWSPTTSMSSRPTPAWPYTRAASTSCIRRSPRPRATRQSTISSASWRRMWAARRQRRHPARFRGDRWQWRLARAVAGGSPEQRGAS